MFNFYIILYIISFTWCKYTALHFKKYSWNLFTRLMSTFNSIVCLSLVVYTCCNFTHLSSIYSDINSDIHDDLSINLLFSFSSYLFVDGLFIFSTFDFHKSLSDFKYLFLNLLILAHHFIGSLGIGLIAYTEKTLFLGIYFACTEFSTFFLNLSWYYYDNLVFFNYFYWSFIFSRLLTLPFLWFYIYLNLSDIYLLPILQFCFVIYGCLLMTLLNLVWFIFIHFKLQKMKHNQLFQVNKVIN